MGMSRNKIKTIFIVEDEINIREMYKFKLEKEGYSVIIAEDGLQGLQVIQKHKPDLVLLDLKMPHMSGEQMLSIMRSKNWGANIRVIVLTNLNKQEADSSLRLFSVDRYIVKAHTTPNELVKVIRSIE